MFELVPGIFFLSPSGSNPRISLEGSCIIVILNCYGINEKAVVPTTNDMTSAKRPSSGQKNIDTMARTR